MRGKFKPINGENIAKASGVHNGDSRVLICAQSHIYYLNPYDLNLSKAKLIER